MQRSLLKGQAKRIYTSMHYGTSDALKTNLSSISASDALSAGTAYTAYVFSSSGSIIARLSFSTLSIPSADAWGPISQGTFVDGSFPYRNSQYQIYTEAAELLLVPFFYHKTLTSGFSVQIDLDSRANCNQALTICTSGSANRELRFFIEQQYSSTSYHSHIIAFKSIDGKLLKISDGAFTAVSHVNLIYE